MKDIFIPVAKVADEYIESYPPELYIPPDSLIIVLQQFEGPLDFLLYLIKKYNVDILSIDVAKVTDQYIAYIETMQQMQIELASDYLVMAAWLTQLKSYSLLPKPPQIDDEEEDPRSALIQRLLEYAKYKEAAQQIDQLPRLERDNFSTNIIADVQIDRPLPSPNLQDLLNAMNTVYQRSQLSSNYQVSREELSTRSRMMQILSLLAETSEHVSFSHFYELSEGRAGVVVSFIAILELVKEQLIQVIQTKNYANIFIVTKTTND